VKLVVRYFWVSMYGGQEPEEPDELVGAGVREPCAVLLLVPSCPCTAESSSKAAHKLTASARSPMVWKQNA
jgi:hypothetical protein